MPSRRITREKATIGLRDIESAISTLDAKMKLLAQRLKIIEMNEQVIGRTLVSHNKKLKEIEMKGPAASSTMKEELKAEIIAELSKQKPENQKVVQAAPEVVTQLTGEISDLKKTMVNLKQQVDELKYTLDSINPLEYVTIDELNEVIDKKVNNVLSGKKPRL
ncbi:MAG: hypothetical protein J7L23_03365 [Candidatus Diapherotrites archaeon]|nr:hypothetical protein [Candidatus Diapherotrites archaeon]